MLREIFVSNRFLCSSTSPGLRAWSNLRVASRTILLATVIVGLIYTYMPIQYEIKQTVPRCSGNQGDFPIFNGIWNLLVFGFGPSTVMLIFGSLTIRHVQLSVKKVIPKSTQSQRQTVSQPTTVQDHAKRQRMVDRQLIQMIIVQCIYFSLVSTPVSIWYIYDALRIKLVIDPTQKAKDNAFATATGVISITGACTSFYLFTLSSQLFRQELTHLFPGRCR